MAVYITLKGRKIPLLYTTYEMKVIQEEIAPLHEFQYIVFGRNKEDENDDSLYGTPKHLEGLATLIRILGNAGLEDAGETPDLTNKSILRAMKPTEIGPAMSACSRAMAEGMRSEIPEEKKDGPVDVTLEEISKKKERES